MQGGPSRPAWRRNAAPYLKAPHYIYGGTVPARQQQCHDAACVIAVVCRGHPIEDPRTIDDRSKKAEVSEGRSRTALGSFFERDDAGLGTFEHHRPVPSRTVTAVQQ